MLGATPIEWMQDMTAVCQEAWSDSDITKDGLRHCRKCKSPKEMTHDLGEFGIHKFAVFCNCELRLRRAETQQAEETMETERRERMRKIALRSPELMNATFAADDAPDSSNSRFIRRYAEQWEEMRDNGIGMLLTGGVGTGKSFLACCLANRVIDYGQTAYFVSVPDVIAISRYESSFDKEVQREFHRFMDKIRLYDLLILDDLGAERDTDYAVEQVYRVIEARSNSGLPLVVTTNLSLAEMKKRPTLQSQRIYDRIDKMCPLQLVMKGESRRKEAGDKRKEIARRFMQQQGGEE